MKADSLGPPVLSGFERGCGRRELPVALDEAVEEAGGVAIESGGKKPPGALFAAMMGEGWWGGCCGARRG